MVERIQGRKKRGEEHKWKGREGDKTGVYYKAITTNKSPRGQLVGISGPPEASIHLSINHWPISPTHQSVLDAH